MLYDQLFPRQKPAADWLLATPNAALFAEQGSGKTWITAAVTEQLLDDRFEAMFVVPLANIETTWEDIFKKIKVNVRRDWESFKKAPFPRIFLTHYEGVSPRRGSRASYRLGSKVVKHHWSLVVYDESQKIKSRGSSQSRLAGRIKAECRRIILSGTPFDDLTDDPQEIWAQMRFLKPDVLSSRWGDYENRYLRPSGYMGYKRAFRPGALEAVLKKVAPYCLHLQAENVVDLPPIEYVNVPVTLRGDQERMYREMEQTMVTTVNGCDVTADLAITQLIKLQQICGGFVKDDDDEIHEVGKAKLLRLRRLVERLDFPLVIFTKYRFEVAQIVLSLSGGNRRISTIDGKTRKTRAQTIRDFQAGKIDILVANIKAGGVGIDLYRSSVVIFYSCTHSYIDYAQALKRVHRSGQKKTVKIYLIYAKNTVDKLIYKTILSKRDVSEKVLKRFRRKPEQGDRTMAKKKTAAAKDPEQKNTPKDTEKAAEKKYGITELADALGVQPASARVKLRNLGIPKSGGRYGWDTKAEMNEVVDKIRAASKASEPKGKKDEDDD